MSKSAVEVELKLTLANETGYRKVTEHLQSSMIDELVQWNVFFNAASGDKIPATIRLRHVTCHKQDPKWYFTVKLSGKYDKGVSERPETECEIPEGTAQTLLSHPETLYELVPRDIQEVLEPFKERKLRIIGDMRTIRRVIPYQGFTLECDEMMFPNGDKAYEIEVECLEVDEARQKVFSLMADLGVEAKCSTTGKLGRLMSYPEESRYSKKFPIQ